MFSMIALYHDKVKGFWEFVTNEFLGRMEDREKLKEETRDQRPDNIASSICEVLLIFSSVFCLPLEGKGDRFAVDEVRDSPECPPFENSLQLCYLVSGLWSLPLTLSS